MTAKNQAYNQKLLLGCGAAAALLLFGLALAAIFALKQERLATRYPGSVPVASHSNYTGLPSRFRWDDTYRTTDNFNDVYNWYSVTFELGAESRANGRCLLLEGTQEHFFLQRSINVFLCNAPEGQTIFVSRFTGVR
ncbi:MAG: hypothetical protein P8183_01175 [Anaerolineae bacterium]|jgi:hypothetical protein